MSILRLARPVHLIGRAASGSVLSLRLACLIHSALAAGKVVCLARLAGEVIVTGLAAGQRAAGLLEFRHGHGGECGAGVVLRGLVVDLVHGDGGVDDVGLDGFYCLELDKDTSYKLGWGVDQPF